jgi:hypothetical protein
MVLTSTSAPASAPNFVGQRFVNTTTGDIYVATGASVVGDWSQLSSYFDTKAALESLLSDVSDLAEADGDTYSGTHNFTGATVNLADNSIANSELADMAGSTIKGRQTGTGDPEDLTASQARTILNVEDGANAYTHPDHTGDVTSTGDGATVIAANAVNNSKLADMLANTLKGRGAVGGDPEDLSATEVRTILNVEDGATADQTGPEIEALVRHDFIQGVNANEHIDWTVDQGATNIDTDNIPDGADATAIHDNVDNEINLLAEKTVPIATDLLLLEDSGASNAKRKVQIGNLPSSGGGGPGSDTTAIHVDTAGEIFGIAEKLSPDGADVLVIEDSTAANGKRKVQIGNLPTGGGGEANLGANVGVGDGEIFRDKTGVTLNFREIIGGTNITVSQQADTVTITGDVAAAPVDSVFTRTGAVVAEVGDYSAFYSQLGHTHTESEITDLKNYALSGGAEHDSFADFVADEHIAHSTVTITAGAGLTGGGTIAATRTIDVGAGSGISVAADSVSVDEPAVNHDNLLNHSTNQHVPAAAMAVFNGGGSDIADNTTVEVYCPVAGTITIASLRSPQTGSVTVTVSKMTFAAYPTPTQLGTVALSSAQKIDDITLSGWTTAVSARTHNHYEPDVAAHAGRGTGAGALPSRRACRDQGRDRSVPG